MAEPSKSEPELLPCPFCGNDAHLSDSLREFNFAYGVVCQGCGASVASNTPGNAHRAWNRRTGLDSARTWKRLAKTPELVSLIRLYTEEVNRRAEQKILKTGKLEGSHHAAMREINQELNI